MNISMQGVKRLGRIAVVAASMGAVGLTALPAQAAGPYHSGGYGSGPSVQFGGSDFRFGIWFGEPAYPGRGGWHRPGPRACMTTPMIYRVLARDGYRVLRIRSADGVYRVRAERHHHIYRLVVDQCSGHVIQRRLVRR